MISADLSRFKVAYKDRLLNVISLIDFIYPDYVSLDDACKKPVIIEIIAINEDGNIEIIRDKSRKFQFVPIVEE